MRTNLAIRERGDAYSLKKIAVGNRTRAFAPVRAAAHRALAQIELPASETVPIFQDALSDENRGVRQAAAEQLGRHSPRFTFVVPVGREPGLPRGQGVDVGVFAFAASD